MARLLKPCVLPFVPARAPFNGVATPAPPTSHRPSGKPSLLALRSLVHARSLLAGTLLTTPLLFSAWCSACSTKLLTAASKVAELQPSVLAEHDSW